MFVFLFFFNETATTEIYTYGHTLSLHDALPISHKVCVTPSAPSFTQLAWTFGINGWNTSRAIACISNASRKLGPERARPFRQIGASICTNRSEEHTSELQSLMRISYAVFCLKKKKNNQLQPQTITTQLIN